MLTYKFNLMQAVVSYSSKTLTKKLDPYIFHAVQITKEIQKSLCIG